MDWSKVDSWDGLWFKLSAEWSVVDSVDDFCALLNEDLLLLEIVSSLDLASNLAENLY